MDIEEFVERLEEGERYFLDLELPEDSDLNPYVPRINRVLRSSIKDMNPIIIDGCRFQRIKVDDIYLEYLNSIWESERTLYFLDCSLRNSNFCRANLKGADFSKSDLSFSNLSETNLEGAKFIKADLAKTKIVKTNLEGADFNGANLEEANLEETSLHGTIFANSNLHKASLKGSELFRTDFREADLSGANLTCSCGDGDFSGAILDEAVLEEVELTHSMFERSSIKNAKLDKSSLYKIDFTDANIEKSSFKKVYLKHVSFENANLSKSDFTDCELEFVDFTDANLKGVNFENVKIKGAFFCRTILIGLRNLDSVEGLEKALFLDAIVTEKEKDVIEEKSNNPINSFILKG
ncbi:MAG TPA: pentapeptide repeat-containing protein [Thermoplasmatales archaeon]|nr:pentapeptide repeat-containing protein [Thermoplasmatales archaeon]